MPEVLFKPIPSRPGYSASSEGYIYETAIRRRLGQWPNKNGYMLVFGRRPRWSASAHRLVCEAFWGPCPPGKECAHNNNIRSDNRPDNLRWATRQENMDDQRIFGTACKGEAKASCKLTESQVREIRAFEYRHGLHAELGRQYGVAANTIHEIRTRQKWRYLT